MGLLGALTGFLGEFFPGFFNEGFLSMAFDFVFFFCLGHPGDDVLLGKEEHGISLAVIFACAQRVHGMNKNKTFKNIIRIIFTT
jgi:hypothetical protein